MLFAAHDYLHVWATRMIQRLAPSWRLGYGPITRDNLEALTFLMLVTEAVAVVGLDYWYLSTFDVNSELPVGTALVNLAVSYREADLSEHRRGHPDLQVQDRAFFGWVCRLYCRGVAEGFREDALKQSPLTLIWLRKELRYGERQRSYARIWLEHLAGLDLHRSPADLTAPVDCSASWQRAVIEHVGDALWRMVKEDDAAPTPAPPESASWASPPDRPFDPRFDNLAALEDPQRELRERGIVPGAFEYLFAQALSSLDFAACARSLRPCLEQVRASRSPQLLFELLRHYPKVPEGDAGPKDLFFLA